ncbi:MAG: hypothetical protein ACYCYO_01945 [Bacilli bacterium]
MSYSPLPGDVFLCYVPSLLGTAIDTVEEIGLIRERKPIPRGHPVYSHAALYVGGNTVIEALGRGLVRFRVDNYHGVADVWSADLTAEERDAITGRGTAMFRTGYTYSYLDIAVQFVVLTTGLRIPIRLDHSIICSVFTFDAWMGAHIKIAKRRNCAPEDEAVYGTLDFRGAF